MTGKQYMTGKEYLENLSHEKLMQAVEELQLDTIPEDAVVRQIVNDVPELKAQTIVTFLSLSSMLMVELARRYKLVLEGKPV